MRNYLLSAAAVALSAVLAFTGCSKTEKPAGGEAGTDSPGLPEIVTIGTQQMPDDEGVAIAKGYFQKELGVKVNIMEFQAGDIRNAMIAKNIDFALLGSSSAALGIASGMEVELIWVHEVLGDAEQLVARDGSGIRSLQDLKGKKVATAFTSTSHYSLLRAMQRDGISEKDVTLLDMQMPDIYAAWQRGNIDAAYAWEPTLSKLLESGKTILSSKDMAAKGVVTSNVEIVRKEFARRYPEIVKKYIKALNEAVELYRQHPDEAVGAVSKALSLSEEEAKKQMQGSVWLDAKEQLAPEYLGTSTQKGGIVNSMKDTADFLYEQKSLASEPKTGTFEQAVNPSYVEQALQ
ncbi:aliphatic sulfonate ABC transporter substrate-binding protein [Caproiciproducens sp. NJN-50]|uniref:taurine ABC transporter substrate-binding protein n=1 Tax=Caproiciproducens sp. NJN-50 TaxID=2507162 RepID=UPI000FFE0961|nr:aliphatic sulfonate ABC transporter substrate-binding protein [Caproiciproducens sp. NJN-50]QAT48896.1 aliphatic sulfonate ABC transporter substrate-binding protein [Caproiciproducens sp. NJN-50]